jgi:hypothetical protein
MTTARFTKPTREQLQAYAAEIGFAGFDADLFLDHYDTVGWVVGRIRAPMKDWKAAVRLWWRNQKRWKADEPPAPITNRPPLEWQRAFDAITLAIWDARDLESVAPGSIRRAMQASRDKWRDVPAYKGRDVVKAAIEMAINNKRAAKA